MPQRVAELSPISHRGVTFAGSGRAEANVACRTGEEVTREDSDPAEPRAEETSVRSERAGQGDRDVGLATARRSMNRPAARSGDGETPSQRSNGTVRG
jgi:hypothetical protein